MSVDPRQDDELAGTEQPFVSHLIELRDRLLKSVYGIAVAFAVLCFYPGPTHLYDLLAQPLVEALPLGTKLIAVGIVTPFLIPLKVALLAALGVSLPWVLYQIWAFVAPGLYNHEKKLVLPLVVSSSLLFYVGVAFCYFIVFKTAFAAIIKASPGTVIVSPDIEAYLNFVVTMFLAFGVTFEVPVAVVVLARMGIVSVAQLKQWRAFFLVGAAAVSGIVTPPDPTSMIALLIPMYLLYELGIVAATLFIKHTQAPADDEQAAQP